jgi:putative tryptophan/tyrosine transport system substrate-binding protein
MFGVRRREFITLFGGAAAAWPLAARAQQVLQVGVLIANEENDPEAQARANAFRQGLQALGWIDGRNVRVDVRFVAGDPGRAERYVGEMIAGAVHVVVVNSSPVLAAAQRQTRAIPIVFVQVIDPVGSGFVESLSRPGGNTTGFTTFEYAIGAKWLELLKEMAPRLVRAAVLRDPRFAAPYGAIQAVAPAFRMDVKPVGMRDPAEIERVIEAFALEANGGLIVLPGPAATVHRNVIIAAAHRHALPAIYPYRFFAVGGGLMSYGFDHLDLFRQAAGYVDRILKGEKPADLPVQAPTRYELVINLKTAKALGLDVPPTLLARADEVIE